MMDYIEEHFIRYAAATILGFLAAMSIASVSTPTQSNYGGNEAIVYTIFIGISSVLLALLIKKGFTLILKIIELLSLAGLSWILFYSFTFLPVESGVAAVVVVFLRIILKDVFIPASSLILSAGSIVFMAVAFPFPFILVLAVGLALYDYIAVFITKHMVVLAEGIEKEKTAAVIEVKENEGVIGGKGKPRGILMGLGDVVMPATLSTSVGLADWKMGVFLILAQFVGYWFVIYLLKRKKGFLPALPPILLPQLIVLVAWLCNIGACHFI